MSNALAPSNVRSLAAADDDILSDEKLWQVVSSGDLKGLSASQKSAYYLHRCRVEGLNPASQPFQYLTLQGKEILYATRSAADQLRKLHGISIVSVTCVEDGEYISYEVRVRDRDHREDFEIGSVFVGTAKGVERSNARMKALTKAKRRATYSICGTGALDETEVGDIMPPAEQPQPSYASLGPNAALQDRDRDVSDAVDVDFDTGEIVSGQQVFAAKANATASGAMTKPQAERILALRDVLELLPQDLNGISSEVTGISNVRLLSEKQAADVLVHLEAMAAHAERASS